MVYAQILLVHAHASLVHVPLSFLLVSLPMLHCLRNCPHLLLWPQDESTAVWARVVATFQQRVYVGALPRSHRSVVAVPSSGRVVLDLVDHAFLPAFKRVVARAHRPRRAGTGTGVEDGVRTRVEVLKAATGGGDGSDGSDESEGEGEGDAGSAASGAGAGAGAGASIEDSGTAKPVVSSEGTRLLMR